MLSRIIARRKRESFVKKTDAWSTVLFFDPLAIPIVKLLAKTRITPNQITYASVSLALVPPILFLSSSRNTVLLGGLVYYLKVFLDCLDGKLARMRKQFSALGKWLDVSSEKAIKLLCLVALSYSQVYVREGTKVFAETLVCIAVLYALHYLHSSLAKRDRHPVNYAQFVGQHELFAFSDRWAKRFVDWGLFPSVYSYFEEQFVLLILAPLLGVFCVPLVAAVLGITIVLKVVPELVLLLRASDDTGIRPCRCEC